MPFSEQGIDKSILDIFDTILKTSAPDKLPTSHFLLYWLILKPMAYKDISRYNLASDFDKQS